MANRMPCADEFDYAGELLGTKMVRVLSISTLVICAAFGRKGDRGSKGDERLVEDCLELKY